MSEIDINDINELCEYINRFGLCYKFGGSCESNSCELKSLIHENNQLKTENEELKEKLRIEHNNFNTLTNAYIETSSEFLKFRKKMRNKNLKKENDRLKKVLDEVKARALNENAGELLEWIVDKEVKWEYGSKNN